MMVVCSDFIIRSVIIYISSVYISEKQVHVTTTTALFNDLCSSKEQKDCIIISI